MGPAFGGVQNDRVLGDAELVELVEHTADVTVMVDHCVVVVRLPLARLAAAFGLGPCRASRLAQAGAVDALAGDERRAPGRADLLDRAARRRAAPRAALAVILAPTDASLCGPAVHDQQVPPRIRFALDAESGFNDGAAVSLLLLFVAGATVTEGIRPASFWVTTALEKIGIGVLAGVLVGLLAGELARRARRAGSSTPTSEGLALAGVAVAGFVFTQELGGSGLVAASVAGLAAGQRLSGEAEPALGFAEAEGAVAATFVFFALGLVGVELLDEVTWSECAYAMLSLFVVRPLAVALALIGTRLRWPTVAFTGWFGPRA